MPGNTMSLYSSTGSNASVSGTNTSGLYGTTGTVTVGTTGYSNVNVAAFLQSYTGNLQAGNAVILGNITAGNIIGPVTGDVTGSVTGNVTGNFAGGNITANYGVFNNDLTVGGTIYGTFSGNITGNLVVPGGNTEILFNNSGNAGANVNFAFDQATQIMSLNGQANITGNVTAGNVITGGNVTANYFIGNGSQLTGLPATYANSDVANFLAAFGSNSISTTGNVTAGYFIGNGATLTSITGANVTGVVANANTANLAQFVTGNAQANITSVGTLTALSVSGNTVLGNLYVAGPGNVDVGNNIISNVADPIASSDAVNKGYVDNQISGDLFAISDGITTEGVAKTDTIYFEGVPNETTVVVSSPSNVTIGLPDNVDITGNLTASSVSATGNITGNYIIGDGSFLTNINAGNISGSYGNANVANYLANFGSNAISTTGNITAGYFIGNGSQLTGLPAGYSNSDVANFMAAFGSNSISTTGNVTSGNIIADAQYLANIPGGNVTGTVANATYAINAGHAVTANTVTDAAQPNITSVGNLTALTVSGDSLMLGNLQVNGNVTYINSNTVTINDKFINVANNAANSSQANGGGIGVGPAGSEYATWSFSDANTAWQSNIKIEAPAVSATGNITGNYIIGDGSLLTNINAGNIVGSYSNANVANYLPTFGGNVGAGNVVLTTNTGRVYVNEIQGLSGAGLSISADGTEDINLNADTIRVGDNNADATIATHGAGDLILRTHLGDASQGNIVIRDGASGNIDIQTNGTGVVNITGSAGLRVTDGISATGNVTAGNVNTAGLVSASGNIVTGAGLYGPIVSVSGNVVGGNAYIAGLVSATGNVTGGNILTGGVVSATGNVTGNYFIGNGSQLTGIAGTYGNANVSNFLANGFGSNNITTTGTITAGTLSASGNVIGGTGLYGSLLSVSGTVTGGNVSTAGLITATGNITGGNINTAGQVTATGNITGGNIFSLGIFTTSGNANISGNLYASNVLTNGLVSAQGNIVTGSGFYGPLVSVTGNINGGGLLQISNNISATGNISTSGRFIGDGSGISNISVNLQGNMTSNINGNGYSIVNLQTLEVNGNINGANLILAGGIEAVDSLLIIGDIDMDGNIIMNGAAPDGGANIDYINGGGYARFGGNVISAGGYLIAGIPGSGGVQFVNTDGTAGQVLATHGNGVTYWSNTASTYNDANVSSFLANFGSNSISTTGNITAGYFIGNGSQLTSITAANITGTVANATYALNANAATFAGTVTGNAQPNITSVGTLTALSVTGNVTGGNLITGGLLTVTGNITGGNISTAGIVTASNLTANLQFANIITNNQQIQTVGARNPANISATVADPGRIVIGTGFAGNLSPAYDLNSAGRGSRLLVSDSFNQTENSQRTLGIGVQNFATLTANITNSSNQTRLQAGSFQLAVGGGASANTWSGGPLTIAALSGAVAIGGGTTGNLTSLGNTTASAATGMSGSVSVNSGSSLRNAYGSQGIVAATGNIGNTIGFATQLASGGGSPYTGNVMAFYHPGSVNNFGFTTANAARQATDGYYFLRNDDDVALNKMGSMWLWHNYRYDHTTTTGAITVDKNNGQTQYLAVTGNITGITLSNFVTKPSNGSVDKQQMDTVTLWIRQDATGRTITMPTGANYFYESGNTTVDITANSISKIEFTAINNAGTTQYLIDISAAYTST